jgi:DNA-directed RNA polymerase specialized sigma54-like protein
MEKLVMNDREKEIYQIIQKIIEGQKEYHQHKTSTLITLTKVISRMIPFLNTNTSNFFSD